MLLKYSQQALMIISSNKITILSNSGYSSESSEIRTTHKTEFDTSTDTTTNSLRKEGFSRSSCQKQNDVVLRKS